jgi:hypothetical protein
LEKKEELCSQGKRNANQAAEEPENGNRMVHAWMAQPCSWGLEVAEIRRNLACIVSSAGRDEQVRDLDDEKEVSRSGSSGVTNETG